MCASISYAVASVGVCEQVAQMCMGRCACVRVGGGGVQVAAGESGRRIALTSPRDPVPSCSRALTCIPVCLNLWEECVFVGGRHGCGGHQPVEQVCHWPQVGVGARFGHLVQ